MNDFSITQLRTPVLLVIFNRPDTTQLVFNEIRNARPQRLYVAADGPRPGVASDLIKCTEARSVVNQVDWPCVVKTQFSDTNLNCGIGPSSAFTWFFENEEEGIILEDDCLPSPTFFRFCQELLERYRDDTRVMHIGGNNFLNEWQNDQDYSYYFSRSGHIWGWATWRRAWKMFDFNMGIFDRVKGQNYFQHFFLNPIEKMYRLGKLKKTVASGRVDWWDYQWDFARYVNSGLSIIPKYNLVRNIGFGSNGTHTRNGNSSSARMQANDIEFPLRHPPFMIRDFASDKRYFRTFMKEVVLSKLG